MGGNLVSALLVGGVGYTMYHFLRAMGKRELAGLLKLACWALAIAFILQLIAAAIAWFESTTFIQFLLRIMGDTIGGGGGVR